MQAQVLMTFSKAVLSVALYKCRSKSLSLEINDTAYTNDVTVSTIPVLRFYANCKDTGYVWYEEILMDKIYQCKII